MPLSQESNEPVGTESEEQVNTQPETVQLSQTSIKGLFTVEGIMMLTLAGLLDVLGLVDAIPLLGTMLSYAVDATGILLIGGWLLFFRQKTGPSAAIGRGKTGLARWFVRGGCILGELIPGLGMLPFWTFLVLFELLTD
jgi:hypothetical protein